MTVHSSTVVTYTYTTIAMPSGGWSQLQAGKFQDQGNADKQDLRGHLTGRCHTREDAKEINLGKGEWEYVNFGNTPTDGCNFIYDAIKMQFES